MYRKGDKVIHKGVKGVVREVLDSGKVIIDLEDGRTVWI